MHGKANGHSCSMGFCLGSSEAGYVQPHQNIMFATSNLDAIKEIHDKNTSLSIYPKKKQAGETYIFSGRNGSNVLAGVGIGILECE